MDVKEVGLFFVKQEQLWMIVNGQEYEVVVVFMICLSDLFRKEFQLIGIKVFCEIGCCGVCFILIDGKLVNVCMIMVY